MCSRIAGHRGDETASGDDRLDQHPGDLVTVLGEHPVHVIEMVPPDLEGELAHRIGHTRPGPHRVVMTVVGPLCLDDQVPSGVRPHEVDGVHGRLGPRAAETPQRQPETVR